MQANGGRGCAAKVAVKAAEQSGDAFRHWLRLLLVAFYGAEESVVADYLSHHGGGRCISLARILGLTQRQVRQALEARLVPDSIVDRVEDSVDEKAQQGKTRLGEDRCTYCISPVAVAITARRLQTLEDALAAASDASAVLAAERYSCPTCRREYDALQAMSSGRTAKRRAAGSSHLSVFTCDQCDVELLPMAAVDARTHMDRLKRFRAQCRDLLRLTRELKDAPVPWRSIVTRPERQERPASDAVAAPAIAASASAASTLCDATQESGNSKPVAEASTATAKWFQEEIDGAALLPGSEAPVVEDVSAVAERQAALERLQEALREAKAGGSTLADAAKATAKAHAPEIMFVAVQGVPRALEQVRDDPEALESMTDNEYRRFFDLEDAAWRRGALRHWLRGCPVAKA